MIMKGRFMKAIISVLVVASMLMASFSFAAFAEGEENVLLISPKPRQVVFLKLDDIREGESVRGAFRRVKEYIDEKDIKVNFGVIGVSLENDGTKEDYYEDYYAELSQWAADPNIEIWHHGYYHNNSQYVEFKGGSYEEQYKQMMATIDLLKEKCGITVRAFGPPYGATDEVTVEVLNAIPQIKCAYTMEIDEGMNATSLQFSKVCHFETAVGVIDYDTFVQKYEAGGKDEPYLLLQAHPGGFSDESFENFKKCIEYLEAQGVEFMTTTQYYNRLNSISHIHPENYKFNQALATSEDAYVSVTLNGNTLESVSDGETVLEAGKDYVFENDVVAIKKDYLMAAERGVHDFVFKFSQNEDAHLTMNVINPDKEPVKVVIDKQPIEFDVEPTIINDRTMVPFRKIFETFGAQVEWDGENNTAIGTLDEITIKLPIDSTTAYINDKPIELDSAAFETDGRTLVPLRFIAENFGATVKWYDETRTAKISSCPTYMTLADGEFKGGGIKVVKTKSSIKDHKMELFTLDSQIVPDDRWAAEGTDVWIQYEFDDVYTINSAAIAWYNGHARKSKFEIAVSENGVDYVTAIDAETAGETDQLEKYEFEPVRGKYVRVICKGNDSEASKTWNSLLEVEIYGEK